MGLKNIFQSRQNRNQGAISVIPALDAYLVTKQKAPNNRAPNVISPSGIGSCIRKQIIGRYVSGEAYSPRLERIFNNGDHVHLRLQEYLIKARVLLMDEVPLCLPELNIQGHTDGFIYSYTPIPKNWPKILDLELLDDVYEYLQNKPFKSIEILEIKSMNTGQFKSLTAPLEEHLDQATSYAACAEDRRKKLHQRYTGWEEFIASEPDRHKEHLVRFRFATETNIPDWVKGKVFKGLLSDAILFNTQNPVDRSIFLYEDKNDQEIKEFVIKSDSQRLKVLREKCITINQTVEALNFLSKLSSNPVDFSKRKYLNLLPSLPEEARGKSSKHCRWCDFKHICYK